ncbi:MAG: hypothetical protein WCV55_02235 [Candidatus Paceibacterota bacterium]
MNIIVPLVIIAGLFLLACADKMIFDFLSKTANYTSTGASFRAIGKFLSSFLAFLIFLTMFIFPPPSGGSEIILFFLAIFGLVCAFNAKNLFFTLKKHRKNLIKIFRERAKKP